MVVMDEQPVSMDDKAIREKLRAPISEDSPVGERVVDDPVFDFVESQMMKVGSLSHAEVRWAEVETGIISLFEQKTKDLKLMTHLLQCFHHSNTVDRFCLSIQVMTDFMETYWETCYPAPGARGVLPRRKFYSQIIQRFDTALEKLVKGTLPVTEQQSEAIGKAKIAWSDTAEKLSLDNDNFIAFIRKLERWLESNKLQDLPSSAPVSSAKSNSVSQSSGNSAVTPRAVEVDTGNEKAMKASLQKVADFLSEFEYGHALSVRVRRFSVWSSITTPPDGDHKGETQLRAMVGERVSEYYEQLQRNPDLALWRKVEQSLTIAPYWFDGQHLSAQIAAKIGQQSWADAILEETQNFLARIPELSGMSFKGGVPFIGEDTRSWLKSNERVQTTSTVNSWDDKRQEAFVMAKEAGLSVAMAMLNDGLSAAKEPRDVFYWRLLTADLLANNGLEAMAHQHYQSLYQSAIETKVEDWEPSLINQLQQFVVTE
ncbi:putative Type VI secretion system-associated protein, VCA0119 [Vibrio nigripulchritudo SOn1]|uniref:Type VI secretion system-associated protein, VCA0119 n=1 Tax=Vibrio nigripulchritudo SOn1 TaxID=1238450 RepID=A0AAV2VTH4_9VIBR|nr:putative Type VI secretion system-associated protein, VCA0119 [Vibrio nigripulchritudo SOn1]